MDKLTNDKMDRIIGEALRSMPLQPPPQGFQRGVLARLAAMEEARAPFSISWLDVALSLFGAGMFGLAALAAWSLPPELLPRLQWYIQWAGYLFQRSLPWLLPALAAGGIGTALCGLRLSARRRDWLAG